MNCPECQCQTNVIDTRDSAATTRRRRECHVCKHRFSTWEITATERHQLANFEALRAALAIVKRLI